MINRIQNVVYILLCLVVLCFQACSAHTDHASSVTTQVRLCAVDSFIYPLGYEISTQQINAYKEYLYFVDSDSGKIRIIPLHIAVKGVEDISYAKWELGKAVGVHWVSDSTLAVISQEAVHIIDTSGNWLLTKSYPEGSNWLLQQSSHYFPAYVSDNGQSLHIQRFHMDCVEDRNNCCRRSIEARLNLEDGSLDTFEIYYPQNIQKWNVGYNNQTSRACLDSFHYYSFAYDPNIYRLNLFTDQLDSFPAQFDYGTISYAATDSLSDSEKLHAMITQPTFPFIVSDPHRNLIYRFFLRGQPLYNEAGELNPIYAKELQLAVYDKDLHLQTIVDLPRNKYYYNAFVAEDGLYISKMTWQNQAHDKSILRYDKFLFDTCRNDIDNKTTIKSPNKRNEVSSTIQHQVTIINYLEEMAVPEKWYKSSQLLIILFSENGCNNCTPVKIEFVDSLMNEFDKAVFFYHTSSAKSKEIDSLLQPDLSFFDSFDDLYKRDLFYANDRVIIIAGDSILLENDLTESNFPTLGDNK